MAEVRFDLPDDWRDLRRERTLEDYDELDRLLGWFYERSESLWADAMRWLVIHDLFFLVTRVDTVADAMDETTGTPIFRRPFILERCRDIEEKEHMVLDFWGRGTGKSTLKTKCRNYQQILRHPEDSHFIWSYNKDAAKKHLSAIDQELTANEDLKRLFPDILYWNPRDGKNGSPKWSLNEGLLVKRSGSRKDASFEAHGLKLLGMPTGSHPNRHDIDDAEDPRRVTSPDTIAELKKAYAESGNIKHKGRFTRTLTGTAHSAVGLTVQWLEDSNVETRFYPGENLQKPGDGPLGGSPLPGFYTSAELWAWYAEIGDRVQYAQQVALDIHAGEHRRFKRGKVLRSRDDLEMIGSRCWVYICIDPTPGRAAKGDRQAIWVWGLREDRRYQWLDGVFRRLAPDRRHEEAYRLYEKWQAISLGVVQVRIEEFAQGDYVHPMQEYFAERDAGVPVVKCCDNRASKEERIWNRWSTPISEGRVVVPYVLSAENDEGQLFNLAAYFLDGELAKYPNSLSDHLLDAGGLLWEDPSDDRYGQLRFPVPEDFDEGIEDDYLPDRGGYQSVGIL